jgi:hypothetical protein
MALVFENKVPASYRVAFIAKVIDISNKLGIDPNWLMAIMDLETGGRFTANITNSLGYTGLIQFGEDSARSLGTTTAKLRAMSAVEQLDYVYKYFLPHKDKLNTFVDTYLQVFFPVAVGKGDDFLIESRGLSATKIGSANKGLDNNKDGVIHVWEVRKALLDRLPSEWLENGSFSLAVKTYKPQLFIGLALIFAGGFYLYKKFKKRQ